MQATRSCRPTTLDRVDDTEDIFSRLRQAVLQQHELFQITVTIIEGTNARVLSLDHDLIFFDSQFYLPAAPPLLPDIVQVLLQCGPDHIALLALGCHAPPTTSHHNDTPTSI